MAYPTSVAQFQGIGAPGMVANAEARNLISRSLVASAFTLGFGEPVYRVPAGSTGDNQCSADPAAGDFLGISRREGTIDPANTVDTFATNDEVAILDEGVIWVNTSAAVAAGGVANFNTTTRLWSSAAIAGAVIDVPNAEFDSLTTGAGLAKVRIRRLAKP